MSTTIKNSDIFKVMEKWAPKHLAYEWDNVGLQVGSYSKKVKKIMITLDVIESVVEEAIEKNVDLIIAHHPLFFKPLSKLNLDTPKGRTVQKLIKHDISVYAAHTNLDIAEGGVNDLLAEELGLHSTEVLVETEQEDLFKIAVFVPISHKEEVFNALNLSGAGHIGHYSHCSFQSKGQGTFKPLDGTSPFIGKANELEITNEVKIETIVENSMLDDVIEAMIKAHPYEEVAYDVYPLHREGTSYGLGRIGLLSKKMSLKELSEHVKLRYDVPSVRVVGEFTKQIKKVAILGGSGEKYFNAAKHKGADVYITGDMTFHAAQDAEQIGLSIIDPGHHVEKVMKKGTLVYLDKVFNKEVKIITSDENTEPFHFI